MIGRPLFLALIPGEGTQLEPPPQWLEAARAGLATAEQLTALAASLAEARARIMVLEAGRNIVVRTTTDEGGRTVATLEVVADARSYVPYTGELVLGEAHNGRVIEVGDGIGDAVVTVPVLAKGFTTLIRATVPRVVRVQPGTGVTFVPTPAPVVTTGQAWEEVAVEAIDNGRVIVRAIGG